MECSTGFLHLSDDLIVEILKYSSSRSTLLSTILVAKSIYYVFQMYPKSILRSLYYHVLGPTFPQALELYRYRTSLKNKDGTFTQALETDIPMTARERKSIKSIERRIVTRLENMFSFMHIDRPST
ncbi:hypothetical protein BT96DRAFT_928262 [Gymnopus androsaceus JB14]|uniref:F-box domain-containing protein n=1 Tax=Gymnopus androsaceus JB14 TaxID=1447944 RepID=A0A6A4GMB0_9AGAR|nr:hypothetical protein BT96DRAFT_928262 [Gymnopus androsaceus JB14]